MAAVWSGVVPAKGCGPGRGGVIGGPRRAEAGTHGEEWTIKVTAVLRSRKMEDATPPHPPLSAGTN